MVLCLFLISLPICWCAIPVGSQRVFGHSIKNGALPKGVEVTTFEHDCSIAPCVITQIHIPAIYPQPWENAIIRIYVDGESEAGLQITLQQLAAEGLPTTGTEDGSPWGTYLMGKTANKGGIYSTVRIPFGTHIKTTIESDPTSSKTGVFWFIIRGLEAHPVVLGDLILPDSARLHLYKQEKNLNRYDLITIANISADRAGALLRVEFSSVGTDFTFLEACMRLFVDGQKKPIFLSSGAEDYFLSAFYFDEGMFKTSQSGLTYFKKPGSLTAYKHHDRDLIVFNKGMSLVFRNYENTTGCGDLYHCPAKFCGENQSACNDDINITHLKNDLAHLKNDLAHLKNPESPWDTADHPANYSTLVWVYEWPTKSNFPKNDSFKSRKSVALGYAAVLSTNGILSSREEQLLFDALLSSDDSIVELILAIKEADEEPRKRLLDYLKRYLYIY